MIFFTLFIYSLIIYIGIYHIVYGSINLLGNTTFMRLNTNSIKISLLNYGIIFTIPFATLLHDYIFYLVLYTLFIIGITILTHRYNNPRHRSIYKSWKNTGRVIKKMWKKSNIFQKIYMGFSLVVPVILSFMLSPSHYDSITQVGLSALFSLLLLPIPFATLLGIIINELAIEEIPYKF